MAQDDKFFTFVCCGALILTAVIFLVSHPGVLRFAQDSAPSAAGRSTESSALPSAVAVSAKADETGGVQPAVFTADEKASTQIFEATSTGESAASDNESSFVEALSAGHFPAFADQALPAPAEILVRKDRDGRVVVASGTRRRYRPTVDAIDALDAAALADEILRREALSPGPGPLVAIDGLLAVNLPEVEPDMVSMGTHWGFVDEEYERLSDVEKHLLLMGASQARAVREKLAEARRLLAGSEAEVFASDPAFVYDTVVAEIEKSLLQATAQTAP